MTIFGFLILGSGLTILGFCIAGRISIDYASYGLLAFLAGWLLSLPGLLGPLTSLTQALFLRWIPVEGKLARLQLLRHRYRTALTIGVLFVAMSSCLGMANTIMDNIRDIQKWYQRAIVGDFFIRAAMPDMATGMSADMPEDLPGKLAAIPGVEQLDSLRFVKARSGEMTVVVVVREFLSERQDYFDLTDGKPDAVLQGLQEGEVVIASVLAQRAKLGIGDQIPLETLAGPKSMRIVGIANDYIGGGLTLYMTRKLAKELFQVEGSDAYVIQSDDRRLPEVEKALMTICKEEGLMLQSYQDLVTYIRTIMNGVTGCLWAVLALGSLIATFGLVNTLAMSILEQTREIGMLRVVAMTRRQIRRMVLAQALQMVWIAIVPGIPAGLIIAYMINLSTLPTTGHAIEFGVRLNLILGAAGFELLLVAVAALIPAERAARIRLADALQYE